MLPAGLERNEDELSIMKEIAESADDGPALMLNLSRYTPAAAFPDGDLYQRYVSGLEAFLRTVGARILWRLPVFGQVVGDQKINEVLAVWYPTHRAFLRLTALPGAAENGCVANIGGRTRITDEREQRTSQAMTWNSK